MTIFCWKMLATQRYFNVLTRVVHLYTRVIDTNA